QAVIGGRAGPNPTPNPPGFFQMPEMSCGSKGRAAVGVEAFCACVCRFCAKKSGVKAATATRATNEAMKRYLMWRLPSDRGSLFLTFLAQTRASHGCLSASELQLSCSLALSG